MDDNQEKICDLCYFYIIDPIDGNYCTLTDEECCSDDTCNEWEYILDYPTNDGSDNN